MSSAGRAIWKGYLKVAEVSCAVSLYTAVSTTDRLSFHTINRKTGNRVHRQLVDRESGKAVAREDQVKGYEVEREEYVVLEPEEISETIPVSNKTIEINAFIACDAIDSLYFERPYYLAPTNEDAAEGFYLIREGLRHSSTAAIAQVVLFRRVHTLLIRAHGPGMIATLLAYDYEVRASQDAFEEIPHLTIKKEMLDLAKHIIETKSGTFDPKAYDDRYENALTELVKAKLEGKPLQVPKRKEPAVVVDLMDALRRSAGKRATAGSTRRPAAKKKSAARKAKKPVARRKAS